ncbi:MAG: hypothetical protein HKO71_00060 [Pseudomonadales bacterium]|nr:hypothetical protein [Pseudomonadales bacterium]
MTLAKAVLAIDVLCGRGRKNATLRWEFSLTERLRRNKPAKGYFVALKLAAQTCRRRA